MLLTQPEERKLHLPSQISVHLSLSVTDMSLSPLFCSPPQSCSWVFTEPSSMVSAVLQEGKERCDAFLDQGDPTGGFGNN